MAKRRCLACKGRLGRGGWRECKWLTRGAVTSAKFALAVLHLTSKLVLKLAVASAPPPPAIGRRSISAASTPFVPPYTGTTQSRRTAESRAKGVAARGQRMVTCMFEAGASASAPSTCQMKTKSSRRTPATPASASMLAMLMRLHAAAEQRRAPILSCTPSN